MEKINFLYKQQFGFRCIVVPMDALVSIIEDMRRSLDKKTKCAGLLLDLTKIFYCVNHQILLKFLENFGIRGLLYIGSRIIIVQEKTSC